MSVTVVATGSRGDVEPYLALGRRPGGRACSRCSPGAGLQRPLTPTAAYPGTLFPHWPIGPRGVLNRVSHQLSRQVVWLANQLSTPFEN